MKNKIQNLLQELNHGLVERESIMKMSLLTLLAGENMLLVGPPGTAKSMLARRIAEGFEENNFFEYLLTKFSTPEEIFGPLSLSELKADRFKRNTDGYLPAVRFAFLDEIFKASSSILNALLTILNERVYHNGAVAQKVPLQALIAASNELPTSQEELSALYDRFLSRCFVDYVSEASLHYLIEGSADGKPIENRLQLSEIEGLQEKAKSVQIPADIQEALRHIWVQHKETFKEDARECLSDRRLIKVVKLLRFSAASNGRNAVNLSDLLLLKNCLWNHPDNASKVLEIIKNTLQQFNQQVPVNVLEEQDAGGNWVEVGTSQQKVNLPAVQASRALDAIKTVVSAKKSSVVKGWMGSGTEADPLQVSCLEDLLELAEPHIGQKGYYFVQTADIDGSQVKTWNNIVFQGHYDGRGFTITFKEEKENKCLFFNVLGKSNLKNIKIINGMLSNELHESTVENCETNYSLLGSVYESSVIGCSSGFHIIYNICANSFIENCFSGYYLILGDFHEIKIDRCSALKSIIYYQQQQPPQQQYKQTAVVKNSSSAGDYFFAGEYGKFPITITNCFTSKAFSKNGFTSSTNSACMNGFQANGKNLDAVQWKQRYFENNMGWDFDNVWVWNDAENRPELRYVGANAAKPQAKPQNPQERMEDLLGIELRDNIWL